MRWSAVARWVGVGCVLEQACRTWAWIWLEVAVSEWVERRTEAVVEVSDRCLM